MKVKREELNPCTIQLEITCSPEQVKEGYRKAIKKMAKLVKVPGFRPGQAPRSIVEKQVPRQELDRTAADEIVQNAFKKALEQEDLKPENRPRVELKELDEEQDKCIFAVKVPLAPKVELGDYKGIKVESPSPEVTDDDIDYYLERLRAREGKPQEVTERSIEEGDNAVINIKPKGEEGEGRTFMVTVGQTFEGLDKLLTGMKAEEMSSADLEFPEGFQESDWAGEKKKVTVTVRSVSAVKLPELTDEFAKKMNADNVDDLKKQLAEQIGAAKQRISREIVNEKLLEKILENSTIHVADTTWESVVDQRVGQIQSELKEKGTTLEEDVKKKGMTMEEFLESQREEAKLHVKRAVVIETIFKQEDMKITEQEAGRYFAEVLSENEIPQEDIKKFSKEYGPQIREEVIFRAMYAKTMDHVREHADITETSTPAPTP